MGSLVFVIRAWVIRVSMVRASRVREASRGFQEKCLAPADEHPRPSELGRGTLKSKLGKLAPGHLPVTVKERRTVKGGGQECPPLRRTVSHVGLSLRLTVLSENQPSARHLRGWSTKVPNALSEAARR